MAQVDPVTSAYDQYLARRPRCVLVLSDLYDADRRVIDPLVARLTEHQLIPHPLHGVVYGDGVADPCNHARRCGWPTPPR